MLPRAPGPTDDQGARSNSDDATGPAAHHEADAGATREAGGPTSPQMPGLGERDLAVLAMERRHYRRQGAKEQAVRDELGLSATRYYQVLNALLDDPAALALEPVLVNRLRRLREQRTSDAPS